MSQANDLPANYLPASVALGQRAARLQAGYSK